MPDQYQTFDPANDPDFNEVEGEMNKEAEEAMEEIEEQVEDLLGEPDEEPNLDAREGTPAEFLTPTPIDHPHTRRDVLDVLIESLEEEMEHCSCGELPRVKNCLLQAKSLLDARASRKAKDKPAGGLMTIL